MTDSSNAETGALPAHHRRERETGDDSGGLVAGGRHPGDRTRTPRHSIAVKFAIACSFLFSLSLIAWAFTLPFRSGGLQTRGDLPDLPEFEHAKLEFEAQLSPVAYIDYARDIDRNLLDQVHEKKKHYLDRPEPPSMTEVRQRWRKLIANYANQLQIMREESGGKTFEKGSFGWQNEREFETILHDAPPGIRTHAN